MLSFQFFNAMKNVKYVVLENKQTEDRRGNSVLGHHKTAALEVSRINGGGGGGWAGEKEEEKKNPETTFLTKKSLQFSDSIR